MGRRCRVSVVVHGDLVILVVWADQAGLVVLAGLVGWVVEGDLLDLVAQVQVDLLDLVDQAVMVYHLSLYVSRHILQ